MDEPFSPWILHVGTDIIILSWLDILCLLEVVCLFLLFWWLSCGQHFCVPMDCSPSGSSPMEFPRREYCSGVPLPTAGDLPDSGIEPQLLASAVLAVWFCPTSTAWEAWVLISYLFYTRINSVCTSVSHLLLKVSVQNKYFEDLIWHAYIKEYSIQAPVISNLGTFYSRALD